MALTPSVSCRDSRQTSTGSPAEACCPRWCDKPGTSTHSLQSDYRPYRILDFDRSEVAAAVRISPASPPTPPLRSGPKAHSIAQVRWRPRWVRPASDRGACIVACWHRELLLKIERLRKHDHVSDGDMGRPAQHEEGRLGNVLGPKPLAAGDLPVDRLGIGVAPELVQNGAGSECAHANIVSDDLAAQPVEEGVHGMLRGA